MPVRTSLVAGLRAVTVAPGTTAPVGSRTKPLRLAVVASACATAATTPTLSARAHVRTKQHAVGNHRRRGNAHINLFSLKDKITVGRGRRERGDRRAASAGLSFKIAREQTVARAGRILLLVARLVKEVCGSKLPPETSTAPRRY